MIVRLLISDVPTGEYVLTVYAAQNVSTNLFRWAADRPSADQA
jgi:hypothetical protein